MDRRTFDIVLVAWEELSLKSQHRDLVGVVLSNNGAEASAARLAHAQEVMTTHIISLQLQLNMHPGYKHEGEDYLEIHDRLSDLLKESRTALQRHAQSCPCFEDVRAGRERGNTSNLLFPLHNLCWLQIQTAMARDLMYLHKARSGDISLEQALGWRWIQAESMFRYNRGQLEAGLPIIRTILRQSHNNDEDLDEDPYEFSDEEPDDVHEFIWLDSIQDDIFKEKFESTVCTICKALTYAQRLQDLDHTRQHGQNMRNLDATLGNMYPPNFLHLLTARSTFPNRPTDANTSNNEHEEMEEPVTTPCCRQVFHLACLFDWCMRSDEEVDDQCPNCRQQLDGEFLVQELEQYNFEMGSDTCHGM